MSIALILAIAAIFVSVAVAVGAAANLVLSPMAPERKRLKTLTSDAAGGAVGVAGTPKLTDALSPLAKRVSSAIPQSPKALGEMRRRLTTAGYRNLSAAMWFSAARVVLPVVFGVAAGLVVGFSRGRQGLLIIGIAAAVGFFLPSLWLWRKTTLRQKAIRNGLPDALDLFIVCLEAGSSLDRAILKASEELDVAHPALAEELRLVTTEIRAGKPRLEAFRNFADRTRVADVRSLVAMLVQTDRFGTSVAEALRTHAEVTRTKRRQRAEEKAAKIGVKLVFPLVFFIFPALYTVILGPAALRVYRVFIEGGGP